MNYKLFYNLAPNGLSKVFFDGDKKESLIIKFFNPYHRIYFYTAHDFIILSGDKLIETTRLFLQHKGRLYSLDELVKTDIIYIEGGLITLILKGCAETVFDAGSLIIFIEQGGIFKGIPNIEGKFKNTNLYVKGRENYVLPLVGISKVL